MLRILAVLTLCCLPAIAPAKEAEVNLRPGPKASPALVAAVLKADTEFFHAMFDTCDIDVAKKYVADDMEFFHDKDGLVDTTGAQFVRDIEAKCKRQREGVDFLSRRELVTDSVKVYALANYGAIQTGVHRFYALSQGKPDRLTEISQFTIVWKEENGQWRLARVLSYDHQLAQ